MTYLAAAACKATEVARAGKHGSALLHDIKIQWAMVVHGETPEEGVAFAVYEIAIPPGDGIEAGMSLLTYRPESMHTNGWRQQEAQITKEGVRCKLEAVGAIEVQDHLPGMYAGIGAACPGHLHCASQDPSERPLQLSLHRGRPGLLLPSGKAGTIEG